MYKALEIIVTGRVQGVGFRPFIYSLATKYQLTGTVQNNLDHVCIHVEGNEEQLNQMVKELKESPPPLSRISDITIHPIPAIQYEEFTIISSQTKGDSTPWIPADAAICDDCLQEMRDPHNRRYQYPFINCTQCGPRYTIIQGLPYDRPKTTMNEFIMCSPCREEYEDPMNRRHHAQPICCSECGPLISLVSQREGVIATNQSAISQTADLLKQGKIIAVKGIGGYHLACDAEQENAIEELRKKKKRPQRPFAIMVKSLEVAKRFCHVSIQEAELLTSSEMPIVILQRKEESLLPKNLSPGLTTLGVMLPYTPLHHLLFDHSQLDYLVMTSANPSGLPIQYQDDSLDTLYQMCDYVLTHNREIFRPIDDSVVQWDGEKMYFIRRARGYVPELIKTTSNVDRIIAFGGNQKNAFAVGKNNNIVMSPHIGDLENEEMLQSFEEQLDHFLHWLEIEGKYLAVDKHPLFASNTMIKRRKGKIIPIQHHYAHHVSCMEDNGLEHPSIGIILDGTGYGEDDQIWGFEFLYGDAHSFERLAHLQYTPLPGGEKAIKEPWRNAVGMMLYYWPHEGKELAIKLFPEKSKEINVIEQMMKHQINTPMAGTCGRLFDAVSAILGVCLHSTYEGEAAIKLSDYMVEPEIETPSDTYTFHINSTCENKPQLDFSPVIYQIIQDKLNQTSIKKIIQKFHRTVVTSIVQMVLHLVKNRPTLNRTVVLSGGSFQNIYLSKEIQKSLQKEGFQVFTHKNVPCHDGGLSLGQMIIASNAVVKNTNE